MNWTGPLSTEGWTDNRSTTGDSTMEIGFKNIEHSSTSCKDAPLAGKGGFPPEVEVQMDYAEDGADAVVWIADLEILRADQLTDFSKLYSVWTNCGDDGGYFRGHDTTEMEVQIGHWNTVKSPLSTFADATLHYLPRELSREFLPQPVDCNVYPDYGCRDPRLVETTMLAPWLSDGSFEENLPVWFPSANVTKTLQCTALVSGADLGLSQAAQAGGNCWAYLRHELPRATGSILYQDFGPANFAAHERQDLAGFEPAVQLSTGSNTGFQFDGLFRCPPDAPEYKGSSGSYCIVGIFLGTRANVASEGRYYNVPADDQWYRATNEYGPQAADTVMRININTYGYPMYMDQLWVTGGL